MYTTSPETYRKDLARKWNIYCRFEYIGPSFPSSILNQIPVCFSPLLSLSRYLVVFPKMSQCACWRTHRFTFALVLLYRDSDRPLAIRCLATFQIADSWVGGLYNRGRIVNDASVWCKMYITEVLCATCISRNRGHKKSIALSRDEL
jgi:hypothetical protein